jgi:hypothetical protein
MRRRRPCNPRIHAGGGNFATAARFPDPRRIAMSINDLVSKLENALSELVTLKITTKVDAKVLQTTIDLAQGDISMSIDPWFMEPAQKAVLDLHLRREQQGASIIKENLAAMGRLTKLLPELKKLIG